MQIIPHTWKYHEYKLEKAIEQYLEENMRIYNLIGIVVITDLAGISSELVLHF